MPTVREIAEFAGVSKSTVSLVLNNKAGVSDDMRQTVLDALRALEAQSSVPNPSATRSGKALSVMVLHPPVPHSSAVFREVVQGIEVAAESFRLQLRLMATPYPFSEQHATYLYLTDPDLAPDGVLMFGARRDEPILRVVADAGLPCVVMGRDVSAYETSGVGRDEVGCGYEVARHLIDLGHERIGFAGGESDYDYVLMRRRGYRLALADAGLIFEPEWEQGGAGGEAMKRLLMADARITAVIFVNDAYAAGGLPILEMYGRVIGGDIAVVSFDDTPIAREYGMGLTSMAYDRHGEAHAAVKLLLDHMTTPSLSIGRLLFRGRLIVRGSSWRLG